MTERGLMAAREPATAEPELEVPTEAPAPGRGILWAVLALLVLQALVRAWIGLRGYLLADDYVFEYRAATHSLLDSHYLFDGYNGHLMPAAFVLTWLTTKLAPLDVWPTVAMDLALQAITGWVLFLLLRELFGSRKAILLPLTLFLFTPATMTGFVWWAAALNQLPAMLAMVTCLYLHVRYLRTGRTRTAVLSFGALLLGLAFFEKVLLFAPLVFLFTAMYTVAGTWWQRLWRTLRLHLRLWLCWLVVLLAYVVTYESTVNSTVKGNTTPTAFLDLLGTSWQALRVTALGGPWQWTPFGEKTNLVPGTGGVLGVVSWLVVVGVVVGSAAVFKQAARAWVAPVAYFIATAALLATGRNQIGPIIGVAYRYYAEVALLAAIALPLALLPLTGTLAFGELTVLTPRSWVSTVRHRLHPDDAEPRQLLSAHSRLVLVRGAVVALILSSSYSTVRFDAGWHANFGRTYIARARADLAKAGSGVVLADTQPPASVLGLFPPYNGLMTLLTPLRPRPHFLDVDIASDNMSVIDDKGHLHDGDVAGVTALPGPQPGCGWFGQGGAGVVVPLPVATFNFSWTLRVDYLASEESRAIVSAGSSRIHVQLKQGPHALFLRVDGIVSNVRIDGLTPHASICTDNVKVGNPVPLP